MSLHPVPASLEAAESVPLDGARALDCFREGAQYFLQQQVLEGNHGPVWRSLKEGMMILSMRSLTRSNLFLTVLLLAAFPAEALALTQILPEAAVEADQQSLMELIGTFDRAQEAIRARDLDALMALYATSYQYHGLRRADIRKIWADLFARYDLIANVHTFSAIKVVKTGKDTTAEITCTGAVWANSRETNQRIPIDSWQHEVHRLVRGKDGWRIVGNVGGDKAVRQFGTAPHPLF